jgi:acyl carrier protein
MEAGAKLYRTGDLARWRSDGVIEFLGRQDDQIKLRGFRIEPGEIETALREQPQVRDAAVILREDAPGEKRLVAYVVAGEAEGDLNSHALLASLRHRLPDYMIPSAIVPLRELPRTTNGKVDRAALPAPAARRDFRSPTTPLEQQLAAIWAEVLGVGCVGTGDNFFELGGHSLSALRLVNHIREKLNVELPVTIIFEAPTLSAMAALIEQRAASSQSKTRIQAVDRAARRIPAPS